MEACVLASYALERSAEQQELETRANVDPLDALARDVAAQDISEATQEAAKRPSPPAATARCIGCILNTTEFKL